MPIQELHFADDAQRFVTQGIWLQQALQPAAATVRGILEWALELVDGGAPLPPVGWVADVGHLALGLQHLGTGAKQLPQVPGFPAGVARTYEDFVLGRLYSDSAFERASGAVCHYQGRDRVRGVAFLLNQLRQRCQCGGMVLNPAVVKGLLQRPPEEVLELGWNSLERDGLFEPLMVLYEEIIRHVRNTGELLGPEDVFELEQKTALAPFGQRVALRQVLQASALLEDKLPHQPLRRAARRFDVPTQIYDEDMYPVGGFSSLSTRGSVESLLHSQLAFMERGERPDLFDIKFLRDELLYYSRDENQFLRRRRTFVFALFPNLVQARVKDACLPWQGIIVLLGLLIATIRRLTQWLGEDHLLFEFVFLAESNGSPLVDERHLMELLLPDQIANGTVVVHHFPTADLATHCTLQARRSLCHLIILSLGDPALVEPEHTLISRLAVSAAAPQLFVDAETHVPHEDDSGLEAWRTMLEQLLIHLL